MVNKMWNDGTGSLMHHGIRGQRWGIRRYQNPDGTLTEAGKKRYASTVDVAKNYGQQHADLEKMTRALTSGVPKGSKILVPTEIKEQYRKNVENFIKSTTILSKKYGDVKSNIVTMDDGHDYVVTHLQDKLLDSYVEYYTLVE